MKEDNTVDDQVYDDNDNDEKYTGQGDDDDYIANDNTFDMTPLLDLCPSDHEQMQCMKHYLAQLFKEALGQSDNNEAMASKRSMSVLCPEYVNRMVCFERYMKFWVTMVRRDQRHSKRMYFGPGKRSGLTADPSKHSAVDVPEDLNTRLAHKRKKSLCASSTDNLSCFEQYLSIYAKIKTANGSQQQNRFVGKRAFSLPAVIVKQVCNDYTGEDRQECYHDILQRLLSHKGIH